MRAAAQAGATLSEILVTSALAGVTAVLAVGIYARGSTAYRLQTRSVALEQRLRAAAEVVARDLRQAGALGSEGAPVEVAPDNLVVRFADPVAPRPGDAGLAIDPLGSRCTFTAGDGPDADARSSCPDLAWDPGPVRLATLVTHRYRRTGDLLQRSSSRSGDVDWTPLAEGVLLFHVDLAAPLAHLTLTGHDADLHRTISTTTHLRNF